MHPSTVQETAAILAGLRLLQIAIEQNFFPPGIEDLATNAGEFPPLDIEAINELCEHINTSPVPHNAVVTVDLDHPSFETDPSQQLSTVLHHLARRIWDEGLFPQSLFTETREIVGHLSINRASNVQSAIERLEAILASEDLRICSDTGAEIESIAALLTNALPRNQKAPDPSDIVIYAVSEDDLIAGYSFDSQPSSADGGRTHSPIDPLNPGASLHLYCFPTQEHAHAFVTGLQFFRRDTCGQITKTFSPTLTAVLVEFYNSAANHLTINIDHLIVETEQPIPRSIAAFNSP